MSKSQGPDIFDIGGGGSGGDDDDDNIDYVILQLTPADSWKVVMKDPFGGQDRVLALAAFALVEVIPATIDPTAPPPPERVVRPMIANEFGMVEDVEYFEDFICLVPPGGDVVMTSMFAKRARELAEQQQQKSSKR